MEKLILKDINSQEQSFLVSLESLIPFGEAEIGSDKAVTVRGKGGVKTASFTAGEDVLIRLRFTSAKPLTLKVGYLTADGEVILDDITPVTVDSIDGACSLWKTVDAGNLVVYRKAVEFFVQIECEGENTFKLESGMIRSASELERLSIYADNLEEIIKKTERRLAQLEYDAATKCESIAVSPSGKKFLINVDDDGNLLAAPLIPNKVLFVGNSLLLGMGFYGMCATGPKKDYFHLVSEHLRQKNPNVEILRAHGARFEQLEDEAQFEPFWSVEPNPHTKRPFCESITPDLNLIIIQLVENVNNDKRIATFEANIDRFISRIKQNAPKARIVWVRSWWRNPRRDSIVEAACRRWNVGCISISDLYGKSTIGHPGQEYELADKSRKVAPEFWLAHPGDEGMQAIADRIIDYLKL